MAAPYTDRTYTPQQQGAKQVEWPLQAQGEYYARTIRRDMIALASEYAPIIGTLTSYTNSLTYSEVLTNGAWTNTALTVTDNQVANPADGQTTASKFLETAANSEHRIAQAVTFTAIPWTVSCIVKGGLTRTNFYVRANDGTTSFSSYFDISAGTVGTQAANTVGAIRNLGGGYYQLLITFTPLAASGNVYFNVASSSSVISYAGNTAQGMYVWACQAGAGTLLAPYIPTTNVARAVSSPYVDANAGGTIEDPFAYLCQETTPDPASLAKGSAEWARLYSRIPKQQIVPATYLLTMPNLPPVSLGSMNANTSSYAVPTSAASVVGDYGYLTITELSAFNGYYSQEGTYNGGVVQNLTIPNGALICWRTGTPGTTSCNVVFATATMSGTNISALSNVTYYTHSGLTTNSLIGEWAVAAFVEGTGGIRYRTRDGCHQGQVLSLTARFVQDYYLPGVTTGIAAYTDITPQSGFSLNNLMGAYQNNATWFNVDSDVLTPWKFPILVQSYTQCRVADV